MAVPVVVFAAVPVAVLVAVGVAVPVVVPVVADGDVADGDVAADGSVSSGLGEVAWLDPALALVGAAAGPLAAVEWLADGLVEGECDGDGEGDGEGVGVPEEGSAWHAVSVFGVVAGAACAVPSTPRVRKLPLSNVTAATLTCAKRIRIACLRCSSGLPCALS